MPELKNKPYLLAQVKKNHGKRLNKDIAASLRIHKSTVTKYLGILGLGKKNRKLRTGRRVERTGFFNYKERENWLV